VLKEWTVTGKKKVTLFKYTSLRHLSFYFENLDCREQWAFLVTEMGKEGKEHTCVLL